MKNLIRIICLSVAGLIFGFVFLNLPTIAYAMTPTLSISATGSSDNVQIDVVGDPSTSVLLFYNSQFSILGDTNSSGIFSSVVSSATYTIASNTPVYVKTGGLSGVQSTSKNWPYVTATTTSSLTLSQSALLLSIGQTSTITANVNSLYLLSNSNPTTANINFNANQITAQALTYGSTTARICVVGNSTNCSNLVITVQNSSAQQLNFSQNNFSLVSGQTANITISGGSGYYAISNNSNSSSIQTSLNDSVVTLTATSTVGAASITICTVDMNNCGVINVGATALNSTAITFSQSNPVVPIGQSTTVTIYGGTGTNFYVSANSNPSIVQVNVSSNILTLIGNATSGTSTVTICAYAGACGSLTINVSSVSSGGTLLLSQSSVSILAGQRSVITISGGSTPYNISTNSSSIFNSNIDGNILTIYGVNPGSATANVCSSVGCVNLYVTVANINSSTNLPTLAQNNILLNVGQSSTVSISGNGGYYISTNSNQNVASASINGSIITVSATSAGSDSFLVCQTGGQCINLYVTVSGTTAQLTLSQTILSLTVGQSSTVSISGNGGYYISTNSNSGVASVAISGSSIIISAITVGTANISICQTGGQCSNLSITVSVISAQVNPTYIFVRYLGVGDKGEDVLKLQQILVEQKFLLATPNGYYGLGTKAAVQKFQKYYNIKQTGNFGPSTKTKLNQIISQTALTVGSTKEQQVSTIQAAIQQLLAQVAQLQNR